MNGLVGEGDNTALGDLTVVEIATGVAGPYCGRLLADNGANVVKVELPGGDPVRAVGPFPARPGDKAVLSDRIDAGALFLWLNANKRGIVLDWRQAGGRRALRRLIAKADVLIHSGQQPLLGRLRLGPSSLIRLNPGLVVTSVTPFGNSGPWRDRPATDLTISALGGLSFVNGIAGREPLKEPGPQADLLAGLFAHIGTLCALADRATTGKGQAVDASSLEAVASALTPQLTQYSYQGRYPGRPAEGDSTLFACKDGYLSISVSAPATWDFLAGLLDLGSAAYDPAVATNFARAANPERVRELLEPALAAYSRAELFELLGAARVSAGMVLSIRELKEDVHLQARDSFAEVEDPGAGEVTYPSLPFRLNDCPCRIRLPAPRLGEHTREVLAAVSNRT
ncbi:MAG: CoA transferase [Chloroflexi bacterium]|nr:CoA transferase [Chloroflexota bacterium]